MAPMRAKGFWDQLLRPAWRMFTPNVRYLNTVGEAVEELLAPDNFTAYGMWKNQPHLRTVLTFLARNTAHVGLHLYSRVSDMDRQRDTTSVGAQLLRRPNATMTMYDMLFALTVDRKLYDRAYWWVRPVDTAPGYELLRLPPAWVTPKPANAFSIGTYEVAISDTAEPTVLKADQVLAFTGYHPTNPLAGSPTIQALKDVLLEQMEAALYRKQLWKRGGRVSAVLTRPLGAKWSDGARTSFREDWYAKWTGNGSMAGGTPILEDGMDVKRLDFSAHEQQFVEASKLAMSTVASGFHVQPSMVGVLDNANFSVVKEFRQMLYTETLGPDFEEVSQRLNGFLLPMLGMSSEDSYFEFNIQRKLAGSFEEQAAVLSTAVGAPWMLRDEARARFNLPKVDSGDQLVVPLNVLVGGQASPRDSGTQNETPKALTREVPPEGWDVFPGTETYLKGDSDAVPTAAPRKALPSGQGSGRGRKAATADTSDAPAEDPRPGLRPYAEKYAEIVRGLFRRQLASVSSRFKAGQKDWWDGERWDKELSHDLTAWAVVTGTKVGRDTMAKYGLDEDTFDPALAEAWYTAQATAAAKAINASTKRRLDEALAEEDPAVGREKAESALGDSRAGALAISAVTIVAGFSQYEAGQQAGATTKTWITGPNPRPEHASMDGETVKLSENFSNGLAWPGDGSGDVAEIAGCNCELELGWE